MASTECALHTVSLVRNGTDQKKGTQVASYVRKYSEAGDRAQLERALARELYRTWESTEKKVLTPERIKFIERIYGAGSVDRVRSYMAMFKNGEME